MFKKLSQLFKKIEKAIIPKTGICLNFKEGIKAYGFESYRTQTILYLSKPSKNESEEVKAYHFFLNGDKDKFEFGETTGDINTITEMAHAKVDEYLDWS